MCTIWKMATCANWVFYILRKVGAVSVAYQTLTNQWTSYAAFYQWLLLYLVQKLSDARTFCQTLLNKSPADKRTQKFLKLRSGLAQWGQFLTTSTH